MSDRDTRPTRSPMPEHLLPLVDHYGPAIQQLLNRLFDDVMASSTDREAVELTHDGLSMMAQMVALAGMQLTGRISMEKGVSLPIAFSIAADDVVIRWGQVLAGLSTTHVTRGAPN